MTAILYTFSLMLRSSSFVSCRARVVAPGAGGVGKAIARSLRDRRFMHSIYSWRD
ncbi:hypothetical protein BMA10399_A0586 [Burkholderia mallei ATCC 10399]|nr:hypothetical protein BMA10399_A0586 [Burkholderia mallei ATCC 10399]